MADPVLQEDVLVNFIVGDERLVAMAAQIAKNVSGIQSATEKLTLGDYFTKLGAELLHVNTLFKDFAPGTILTKGVQDTEAILKAVKSIGASANMTGKQFAEMNAGIAQAAAETGNEFGAMAEAARDLYGQTGLKEGLGQTLLDSERLGLVFGANSASFAKLTASVVQFGDGTVKADDVMKSFDKTSGLTGKRMDDMLETLTEVSKTMRNVVGGGKNFGESMKQITEFSGKIASQFTEMGGDSATLNQLMKDVMDPNKWGEISAKMPGMAGNLFDMQQAMASGDMDKFGKLLKSGAQQTADMGAGMSVIARSAAGIDFTSAEVLTKVDWKKMGKDAASGTDVMTRSAEMVRSVGEEWTKFLQNMSKAIIPLIMPILTILSSVLSFMNRMMQMGDGMVGMIVTWGIIIIGLVGTFTLMSKKLIKSLVTDVGEGVAKLGTNVGKAAGNVVGGFMETVGKAAQSVAKFALPMLQVGIAMLAFAAAVYVLAEAFMVLGGVDMGKVVGPLLAVVGLLTIFALASVLLAPVAPMMILVGGAFLLFAGSVWILAEAMKVMAESFVLLNGIDFMKVGGGLLILAGAMLALVPGAMAMLLVIPALTGLSVTLALLDWAVGDVGTQMDKFAKSLGTIAGAGKQLAAIKDLDLSGVKNLGSALEEFSKIKLDVSVTAESMNAIGSVIDIIKKVAQNIVDIIVVGMMAAQYRPQLEYVMLALFDPENGLLISPVKNINKALVGWVNVTIPKNVLDSLLGVMDLLGKFNSMFLDLAVMGMMLTGNGKVGGMVTRAITFAIDQLSNIVKQIDEGMVSFWGNTTVPKNVMDSLTGVLDVVAKFASVFIDLAVMGGMLATGAGQAGGVGAMIDTAISSIFGKDGFMNKMMDGIKGQKGDPKKISEAAEAIKSLGGLTDPLIGITAMGTMFKSGEDKNLYAYADTLGEFMKRMHNAAGYFTKSDLDGLTKITESLSSLTSTISHDVEISSKTKADVAISDHTAATAAHQQNVEKLLTDIRDGLQGMSKVGSREQAATNGNVPAWQPEHLFSDVSGVF